MAYARHLADEQGFVSEPYAWRMVADVRQSLLVELGRSIRTVGDMVSYGPNVPKL